MNISRKKGDVNSVENYLKSAVFEHQFWLQVLGDHSRFIYDSLYPSEKEDISKAVSFIHHFDQLLSQVSSLNESNAILFTNNVEESVKQLRTFKLSIIERHITSEMKIHLTPTFINHMVNEFKAVQGKDESEILWNFPSWVQQIPNK